MHKQLLFLCYFISLSVFSQDIIYRNDGSEIQAKVIEITSDFIKYRNFSQPDGPIRNISIRDVFMIIYEDGQKEIFRKRDNPQDNSPTHDTSNNGVYSEPKNQNNDADQKHGEQPIYINPIVNSSTDYKNIVPGKTNQTQTTGTDKYFLYNKNQYVMIAVGYGNSYGGFGVRFQNRWGRLAGFGLHVGGGYFPFNEGGFLWSVGCKFFMYKGFYMNAQYGAVGIEKIEVSGSMGYSKKRYKLFGPSFLLGCDWIFGKHVGFNAGLGIIYTPGSELITLSPALDVGLNIKF